MLTESDRKAIEKTIELFPKIVTDKHVIEYVKENMKEISDSYTACAVAENLSNSNNNALQVIESISEDLVLYNEKNGIHIVTNIFKPQTIKVRLELSKQKFIRFILNKSHTKFQQIEQLSDDELKDALYEYICKLYDRFITNNELEINKRDIYIDFTKINVMFEFNYIVNLNNVKKVEYITYSLLQHFR
jgi:uncharacterized protein (UPF0147 family)